MSEPKITRVTPEEQEEWMNLAEKIYRIIIKEIEKSKDSEFLYQIYPKLVICYQFFDLIRGEGFDSCRPPGIDQGKLYKMGDDIKHKLKELSANLSPDDERVKHYIEETRSWIKVFKK